MKFAGLVFFLIFGLHAFAQTPDCVDFEIAGQSGQACSYIPSKWDGKQIAYHLHGAGGNAQSWGNNPYYKKAMEILDSQKVQRPAVVTISFGSMWFLKDFGLEGNTSPLLVFVRVLQEMEYRLMSGKTPDKRILIGESMGGYNSLLLLSKGGITFNKSAILCPGFAGIGPYSSQAEIQAYIERHRPYINENLVLGIIEGLKDEFPTQTEWDRHAPFFLASTLRGKSTQFYVMGNTRDQYGFGEGAQQLQAELKKFGLNTSYESVAGAHCVMNSQAIAHFFAK